ncbi:TonB-dependent siderophore receptor [Flavobacterium caeni]|uniref:Iron complex outermembrane recepter protein n=1 Tax=Flavobacterium caeni TaxID=490189 RepID=A0A1G5JI80_9FLAO|nr:TonB-dependent siderophore receptor [Flavobacterium caeni]SCY87591.1 iron complex outermembrane recepter protein [Flavobacterium caeni]
MHNAIFIATALLFLAHTGHAQNAVSNFDDAPEAFYQVHDTVKNKRQLLEPINITVQAAKPLSVLKSGIKPMDLPQSIQVIGAETLQQQQVLRLSDVVKNANGVYVSSARGGAQESFYARGYDMSANNMFKNGFRTSSGSMPEVASLDKVEILKGSSALLYGNVAPGGILNMVTKTPLFVAGGEIAMQAGSYALYKPTVDVYGPLNNAIAYRFVGTYENSESFRDNVARERYYLNPSVLFKASAKTEILLQADYLHDDWTPDFGTGAVGRNIAEIGRDTYLGALWSNGQTRQASVSGLLTHKFNENWKLGFATSFQNYKRTSEGTERIQPLENGDWNRPLGKNRNEDQIAGQQLSLQGNFNTGKIKHQLFTGVDFEYAFSQTYTFKYDPAVYDMINIFYPSLFVQRTDIPYAANTKIVKTEMNRFGAYAQDLISVTEKIKVLAGIRWSWQESQPTTHDLVAGTVTDERWQKDVAFSPKVGLVYQPLKSLSLYASYANSFTPNTGVTILNETLDPSIIDQYEVGVKNEFWGGLLEANVTLYQIVNSNLAQMAQFNADGTINTNSAVKVLSGETTSKGIEVDLSAKPIDGLNLMAGYSYNNMRYTKTSGITGSFIEGDRLVRTPVNTANLSAFYTVPSGILKGISCGAIANYIGDRLGGWNNTVGQTIPDRSIPLEGYTTVDVSAGYTWRKLSFLCKLSNVGNVLNYTVHENYSVNPIAPRQLIGTLRYKF